MPSFNHTVLVGNLTRNPNLRRISDTTVVCDITIAVNSPGRRDGQMATRPTYIDVTFWNQQAEYASRFLTKGAAVLVAGRLKSETWEANDGTTRSKLKVVASHFQLLGKSPLVERSESSGEISPEAVNGESQDDGVV